jgi:hypothetical protein
MEANSLSNLPAMRGAEPGLGIRYFQYAARKATPTVLFAAPE